MGLQRWNTTEYSGVVITTADVVSLVKEMANMLADHTDGTLTETTDTTSTYNGIVDFGEMAYQFYANATSATGISVQTKLGYMSGGNFTAVGSNLSQSVSVTTSVVSYSNVAVLHVVDGGEYIELQYRLSSGTPNNMCLRILRLTSSLDAAIKRRIAYVVSISSGSNPYQMYGLTNPSTNFQFINDAHAASNAYFSAPTKAQLAYVVGSPRVVLYPVLFWMSTLGYYMGVPTFGGKRIYICNANVPAGTAYYVGTTQYLCVGELLHIVNT